MFCMIIMIYMYDVNDFNLLSMKNINDNVGAMLLSYSRQVASAMVYLSVKGYIHCDLAARNILLSIDGVCKVRLNMWPIM